MMRNLNFRRTATLRYQTWFIVSLLLNFGPNPGLCSWKSIVIKTVELGGSRDNVEVVTFLDFYF